MTEKSSLKEQLIKHTLLSPSVLPLLKKMVEQSKSIQESPRSGFVKLGPFGFLRLSNKGEVVAVTPPGESPSGVDYTGDLPSSKLAKSLKLRWKAGTRSAVSRLVRLLVKSADYGRPVDIAGSPDFDLSRSNRYLEEQTTRFAPEANSSEYFEPEEHLSNRRSS